MSDTTNSSNTKAFQQWESVDFGGLRPDELLQIAKQCINEAESIGGQTQGFNLTPQESNGPRVY